MNTPTRPTRRTVLQTSAAAALAANAPAAETISVDDLIAKLRSKDDNVRGPAWQKAGPAGAAAVKPLVEMMSDPDFETARSARRALWNIVHHAGRPGAEPEARAVGAALLTLLKPAATPVRREILWMLSELAGDEAIEPMAALLADQEVHDDARCALQRIPGAKAAAALRQALASVPAEYRFAIADSLRARGEKVDGYPTQKLKPTRQTTVKTGQTS